MNDCLQHRDTCLPEEYCCEADTLRLEFLPGEPHQKFGYLNEKSSSFSSSKMFVLYHATGFFAEVLLGITTSTQRILTPSLLKHLFGDRDEDFLNTVRYCLTRSPENYIIPAHKLATQTLTAFCANPSCGLRGEAMLKLRGISCTKRHTPVLPLDESIAVAVDCHDGVNYPREDNNDHDSVREYLVLHLVSSACMPLPTAH